LTARPRTLPGADCGDELLGFLVCALLRHGWAELLILVDTIRRLAYSQSLAPDEAMRRIRDAFADYDDKA
jgi:hypothetical protein